MSIVKKKPPLDSKLHVDLDGPDGNAFAIIGLARNIARKSGLDADAIAQEMMGGDYTNVLRVFDRYFGSLVVFETEQEHSIEALSNE